MSIPREAADCPSISTWPSIHHTCRQVVCAVCHTRDMYALSLARKPAVLSSGYALLACQHVLHMLLMARTIMSDHNCIQKPFQLLAAQGALVIVEEASK